MTRRRSAIALLLVSVTLVSLSACSSYGSNSNAGSGGSASPAAEQADLTVFAASSLTGAFTQIGKTFEQQHAGTHVTLNFGASDDLAGQIQSEGTADLFASASPTWMDAVQKKPGVSDRSDFAQNTLIVIVPQGNPADIKSIDDLANSGVQLVLAAKGVPVGDYAREALSNAGIAKQAEANVVSNEEDDASVVQKISTNEADAAIVYSSDIAGPSGAGVDPIAIPDSDNVIATYPIAVVTGAPQSQLAAQFVDEVTGSSGQSVLKTFGFLPPPSG
jgi:molybdate transport system substrate-binding protein